MATAAYCDRTDVEDRLSVAGVSLRADDLPQRELGNALVRAARRINQYLQLLYDPARLAASEWVVDASADIAAYLLAGRRGNPVPASIAKLYDERMEELKAIAMGKMVVPDVAARVAAVPVLSNIHSQLTPVQHPRVERSRSTGKATGYSQRQDRFDTAIDYAI